MTKKITISPEHQSVDSDPDLLSQLLLEGGKTPSMDITLEDIISAYPKESFTTTCEDRAWMNMTPVGKEIW